MGDEAQRPPDLIATGLAGLIEGLRDDVREDIRDLRGELGRTEERVTARVASLELKQGETRELLIDFAKGHGEEHEEEATERRAAHSTFYEFMRTREIQEARRDGALGVIRFGVELVSKHSPRLVQIALALTALLGIATGSIHLAVGA
jgi:hypothetical protein